jgi:flagellar biosynthesis chaperone FliJ
MKRFVWRLQRVLDVKAKEEQLKRTELFRLTEQLAAQRGELLMRQRILRNLLEDIRRDASPERWSTQEFLLRRAAVDDERIGRLREGIAVLEIRHREKTAEVLAVRRFKEGLEKLRAQAREEYIREEERLEQREADERTTIVFARQNHADRHGTERPHQGLYEEQNR